MKTKRKTFLAAVAAFIAAPFARGKAEPKQVVVKAHDPSFGQTSAINIIFDGPPGPEAGRFVEVELDDGRSINVGEWVERPDGMWALRITRPLDQEKVAKMREMLEVQGSNGNWNYDSYMHGMYNGMEFMLAIMEDREPDFRPPPEKWLSKREGACPDECPVRTEFERSPWTTLIPKK